MNQPRIKLISFPVCPYVQRSAFLMQHLGVEHVIEYIDLKDKPEWFLNISPMGKVPVLLVDDDILFESHVILEYLNETNSHSLHPADPLIKARHRALMELGSVMLSNQRLMLIAQDEETSTEFKNKLFNQLTYLEQQMTQTPYFAGRELCLLDFSFAPLLQRLWFIHKNYVPEIFDAVPKTEHWTKSLLSLPALEASAPDDLEQRFVTNINNYNGFLVW